MALPHPQCLCTAVTLLVTGIGLSCQPTARAREWHVAPTGSDSADGTPDHPFASLERARDAVRATRQANAPREPAAEQAIIRLHGGMHQRSESFELDARDAGIRILGAADGSTRLHAGTRLMPQDFRAVTDQAVLNRADPSARDSLVALDLEGAGIRNAGPYPDAFRDGGGIIDLYWNDTPLPLARWPNEGWATIAKIIDSGACPREGDPATNGGIFEYSASSDSVNGARYAIAQTVFVTGSSVSTN